MISISIEKSKKYCSSENTSAHEMALFFKDCILLLVLLLILNYLACWLSFILQIFKKKPFGLTYSLSSQEKCIYPFWWIYYSNDNDAVWLTTLYITYIQIIIKIFILKEHKIKSRGKYFPCPYNHMKLAFSIV